MYQFDANNVKIAEPRVFANWNETAVCFNDSRLVCSKPKSANLSQYERVIYAPDCQTPIYGIKRLTPEQKEKKQANNGAWKEEPEVMNQQNASWWVEIR